MTDIMATEEGGVQARDMQTPAGAQRLRAVAFFCGLILFALWALGSDWLRPIEALDLEQTRLNVALAPPQDGARIVQTFRPRHDGLYQVELLLAQGTAAQGSDGLLRLQLTNESGQVVAGQSWAASQLRHNQSLALRFAPQAASGGQLYTLAVVGEGDNPFGAWAYDLDVLAGGMLQTPQGIEGDLRFVTRYQLQPAAGLRALADLIAADGLVMAVILLLLPLPGCLVLLAAGRRLPALDGGAWWGVALALGMALWPLMWLWVTVVGGRWTAGMVRAALVVGWGAVLALWLWRRRQHGIGRRVWTPGWEHGILLLLLVAALLVRLLAVRDLAFPPWVDSSRHALITMVMVANGQMPGGYAPFLAVDSFTYHAGFHALAAMVVMLVEDDLPRSLLVLGQMLNALAALSIYSATWLLTRRRGAALLAAFLVALPFFFPAYYVTWGRFTQLSGALLLGPLLALTWLLARGARGWRRIWWPVGVLVGGLFLTHVRVFLIYVPFGLLAWAAAVARGRWRQATTRLAAAGGLALVLAGPRVWQLVGKAQLGRGYLSSSGESYAAFPTGYVTAGWERWFLALGGVALAALAVLAWRGGRRALVGVALGGWAGLVSLLLSGRLPGVPLLWLINLNSAYILLFVPLALLLGVAFAALWRRVSRRRALAPVVAFLLGMGVAAGALFGAQQQASILNETTILAREADVAALQWAARHTPEDARFVVNSWRWLGQTWAAGDGGAWLLPVTGRQATTPPVDYIGNRALFEQVIAFNEQAMAVEDWSAAEVAAWLAEEGVTHLFVGARGGFLDPAALARNEQMRMLYGRDGVFVFEVMKVGP